MMTLKILALTPFVGAGVITTLGITTSELPEIQYGALGLCAIVVIFLCNYLRGLTNQHAIERKELVDSLKIEDKERTELIKQNTSAYNRLAQLLEDRPCLCKDSRINSE